MGEVLRSSDPKDRRNPHLRRTPHLSSNKFHPSICLMSALLPNLRGRRSKIDGYSIFASKEIKIRGFLTVQSRISKEGGLSIFGAERSNQRSKTALYTRRKHFIYPRRSLIFSSSLCPIFYLIFGCEDRRWASDFYVRY